MEFIIFVVVFILSYIIGVLGWAQIVGGFQNLRSRGPKMLITIIIWALVIGGSFMLMNKFAPECLWAWVIAIVISLLQVLRSGKIE